MPRCAEKFRQYVMHSYSRVYEPSAYGSMHFSRTEKLTIPHAAVMRTTEDTCMHGMLECACVLPHKELPKPLYNVYRRGTWASGRRPSRTINSLLNLASVAACDRLVNKYIAVCFYVLVASSLGTPCLPPPECLQTCGSADGLVAATRKALRPP